MWIEIELMGIFRQQRSCDSLGLELPPRATVADALRQAGLPDRIDLWVLVNGSKAARDQLLEEKDRLTCFQPVGGG